MVRGISFNSSKIGLESNHSVNFTMGSTINCFIIATIVASITIRAKVTAKRQDSYVTSLSND